MAGYARSNDLVLITRDVDFADIRNYPPSEYPGIIVLRLSEHTTAAGGVDVLQAFLNRDDWLGSLRGRLAILELSRVRMRSG